MRKQIQRSKTRGRHFITHLKTTAIILLATTASACARPIASSSGANKTADQSDPETQPISFETSANEVHFEAVDESGAFIQHQIVVDPMRGQYERGLWIASARSPGFQVNSAAQSLALPQVASTTSGNRVNLNFVGDGYATNDLPQYHKDVTNIIGQLKTQEPFLTYANYFNFKRVDVVSRESGVSQDPKGKNRDTALSMNYYCSGIDRLLCGNLNKIVSEAQNAGPFDAIFALANSETYGGAGYTNPPVATFAGRNPGSLELALHEFGHSFGLLADEYSDAGTANTCLNYANIAQSSASDITQTKTKWYRWLGFAGVGAFEGACYHTRGFYRPTDNSKMRALAQPFGAVNTEQFILQLYKKVKPIDISTPEGTYTAPQTFVITPMKPLGHSLKITWSLDNQPLPKFDGVWALDSKKLGMDKSTHELLATVVDPTPQVRDEEARRTILTQTKLFHLKLAHSVVVQAP